MSISANKFLLILLILGILVQTFSCTLHFPEEVPPEEASVGSSNSEEEDPSSSSLQTGASSSSSNKAVSSSSNNKSSSSNKASSSSSGSGKNSSSSNGAEPSSSSVCTAKDNTETQYCSGGTMKDYDHVTQGDKTYKTVVIGDQTWMAENMNYNPGSGNSRCYGEGNGNGADEWLDPIKDAAKIKENCDKYGRLYDWATAKTVCPSGWSLPDTSNWGELRRFIEDEIFHNWEDVDFGWDVATKLKAVTGWKETATSDKGVDSYGFGAIGTGYCVSCESLSDGSGFYEGEKTEAQWWSASPAKDATQAFKIEITYVKKVMNQKAEKKDDYLYSVRCIKK